MEEHKLYPSVHIVFRMNLLFGFNVWIEEHLRFIVIPCLSPLVDDQCQLYCKAEGYNFFYMIPREVTDGTRCNDYSTNVCVQGKCQVCEMNL